MGIRSRPDIPFFRVLTQEGMVVIVITTYAVPLGMGKQPYWEP